MHGGSRKDGASDRVARFAAEQPELTALAVRLGYADGAVHAGAVLEIAATAAELLARRVGGPLPRVVDPAPWCAATADQLRRTAPALMAALQAEPGCPGDRAALAATAPILLALEHAAGDAPRPPWPWLRPWAQRAVLRARRSLHPERDDASRLPRRLHLKVWLLTLFAVASVYVFMWSVVHVMADMRPCMGQLPDPFHELIPFDARWWLVSIDLYVVVILTTLATMFAVAFLGDHRPIVRWGMALAITGLLRSATILLVPLCRIGVEAGTSRLAEIPMVAIGPFDVMWRAFASNDLLFSGHVAECILALRASRSWPRPIRLAMWLFLFAQAYALLATRGHYTVDILVAWPMAYLADRLSLRVVEKLAR